MPFWVKDDQHTFASILVRAEEVSAFDPVSSMMPQTGFAQSEYMSQRDASEVLNIKSAFLAPWSEILGLEFSRRERGLAAKRSEVERVARQIAWTTELAFHLGVSGQKVGSVLSAAKITRKATGWSRVQLIEKGVLPQIP